MIIDILFLSGIHHNVVMRALLVLIVVCAITLPQSFALQAENLGSISNMVSDNYNLYYSEVDKNIKSQTWIPDTHIMSWDIQNQQLLKLSEIPLMYTTELSEYDDQLFMTVLSESCMGEVTCDFQDVISMSKDTGKIKIIMSDVKSASHLFLTNSHIYISESSGKIWQIEYDGSNPKLLYENLGNVIMQDLTVYNDVVFWIEEIDSDHSQIMMLKDNITTPIRTDILIPYDLVSTDTGIFWEELEIEQEYSSIGEFVRIMNFDGGDSINEVLYMEKTSKLSPYRDTSHYGSFYVHDGFVYFANNTGITTTIQRQLIEDGTIHDVGTADFTVKFLRADEQFLYIMGVNQDGFVIDRITLANVIPVFPVSLVIMVVGFTSLLLLGSKNTRLYK